MTDPELDDILQGALEDFKKPIKPIQSTGSDDAGQKTVESLDADFLSQLTQGMEELFKCSDENESNDIKQSMNEIMKSLSQDSTDQPQTAPSKMSFKDAISSTIDKLDASEEEHDMTMDRLPSNITDDDSMQAMLKELEGLMESGDFNDVFDNMVGQLLSRDILYEPMKELSYPAWIKTNESKIDAIELQRYKQQQSIVYEIIEIYEKSPQEPNEQESQRIVDLMQKMQESGNPPDEIMKDMNPNLATVGLGGDSQLPGECSVM